MKVFLRKPTVKIFCGILCIFLLTVAVCSAALAVRLLSDGVYEGEELFRTEARKQMQRDARDIITDYFNPYDPEYPLENDDSSGIYTGEDSNFRYTITDEETGSDVLSTYDGAPALFTVTQTFSWEEAGEETEEETVEELYALNTPLFCCDGVYYLYYSEQEQFFSLNLFVDVMENCIYLDGPAENIAILYQDQYYTYHDGAFRPNYTWEEIYEQNYDVVERTYTITGYLLEGLPASDPYRSLSRLTAFLTEARYAILGILPAALVLGLLLLIALGLCAGRYKDQPEPAVHSIYRIPPDLAAVLCIGIGFLGILLGVDCMEALSGNLLALLWIVFCGTVLLVVTLAVYFILMLCVRGKTRTLVSGAVLCRCWKALRKWCGILFRRLPVLWKILICYAVLCAVELFLLSMVWQSYIWAFVLWIPEKLLLGVLVCYAALALSRLKAGAQQIAAGESAAAVSSRYLVFDFKETADALNHIQDGVNAAVENRMRSERLRTELLTNVSHDLKTPLTAIISYVGLLQQEPVSSEAAEEYLEVLNRQSMRLKKLIEDLVEASKASTGNLQAEMAPLDFCQLLNQAMGEYAQRLTDAGLTPVVKIPETPVTILADGKLLWRVLDNLLENIVKYAMPDTRLYLQADAAETVTACFRNISREPLNMDAEDLLERFTRGDVSRSSEGNGLGLSIAQSLTEAMGGTFTLCVDGDLFKVSLSFPVLRQEGGKETA